MSIFEYTAYKKFLLDRIQSLPKKGYGVQRKLAEYLSVSTTFISQVLQGDKSFNLEQGSQVCEYFGLADRETEYFLKLILIERAGTEKLRAILQREAKQIREQSQTIASRLKVQAMIGDDDKAKFYSEWHYSAIRLLVGLEGYDDLDAIAAYFALPRETVVEAVNFLLETKLLKREGGRLQVGPSRTHLASDSPFIKMHHANWRYKALETVRHKYPEKLHYSAPLTLGREDALKIRALLLKAIEDTEKIIAPSPNEELMCLNIDWFKIQPGR